MQNFLKTYKPKIICLDPYKIIPFHKTFNFNFGIFYDYLLNVYVPPIPIIRAPFDLKKFGEYVNYNGHHRTLAAKRVKDIKKDFLVSCIVLDNLEDILYLKENPNKYKGEVYSELIDFLELTFEAHRDFVWNEARRFKELEALEKNQ